MTTSPTDSEIIDAFGGTAKVARLCDLSPPSVSVWRKAGIPKGWRAYFRLLNPKAFKHAANSIANVKKGGVSHE
jgi:hypothetical protein